MYVNRRHKIVKLYTGTVTASGDSKSAYKFVPTHIKEANFFLKAVENSGTATMDVKVVTQHPRITGHTSEWFDLQAFTQLSANGTEKKAVGNGLGDKLALVWTVGGTGNWTITVYAELKVF